MPPSPRIAALVSILALLFGVPACGGGGHSTPPAPPPPPPNFAFVPAQHVTMDLIGIHDPASADYDANCIGCHGDRTDEVALDGVTPAAHATMLSVIQGTGNDRCLWCHATKQDFLSHSQGGLREPVDMEAKLCTACHGATGTPSFYVR